MVAVTVWVAVSITDTVPSKELVTKTVPAAGSTATPNGLVPTPIVAVTVPVAVSITDTVLSNSLAT
jgi:hypothetical protein